MDRLSTGTRCLSRRRFLQGSAALVGLGLVSGCGGAPPWAQPPKVRRIGMPEGSDALDETQFASFRDGLRELGYVEGENLVIEKRFARNDPARFPALIAELEAAGVEVIVCGGLASCIAVKQANPPIPTVAWNPITDAVGFGLVQNIARPEGNMTGIAGIPGALFTSKQLEKLHAAVPDAGRVGVLAPANWPSLDVILQGLKDAASRLVLDLEIAIVQDPSGIESAISALSAAGARALVIIPGTMFITNEVRTRIAQLTRAYRLPSGSSDTALPRVGGLLAYSPNRTDVAYRLAWYVDKILKGAKPADLPMERPSKFDLIINLKTAQALGLTIPQGILAEATEVIQ